MPIYLIIRQVANSGPREREFLTYKRDFIFRAIMFCFEVDVKMDDPVYDLGSLPELDEETITQLIAQPLPNGAAFGGRLIENRDIGFIIETINILVTSFQFQDAWVVLSSEVIEDEDEEGEEDVEQQDEQNEYINDDGEKWPGYNDPDGDLLGEEEEEEEIELYYGSPNEPHIHSKRNVDIIEKFIKILLTENNFWVDCAISMSIHMCVSSKDSFEFFLGLFGKEFITARSLYARNFIKLFVSLLLNTDGKEEWRRREFTNNLVSLLKKFSEKEKRNLMVRAMDGYSLIYNLTNHVLLQSYTACKSEITSLLSKFNISISFY